MQLVSEHVQLFDTMRDRRYGPAEVAERFGVPPERVLDVRALVGDSTDNIPGVKGIGEKGAAKLIQEYGSLEALLAHAGDVASKRAREALGSQADAARLSKELATLHTDAPGCDDPDALALRPPDVAKLRGLYARLELRRLLDALEAEARGGAKAPAEPSAQGSLDFAAAGVEGAEAPAAGASAALDALDTSASLAQAEVRVDRADDRAALERLARELASRPRVAAAFCGLAGPGGLPPEPAGVAFAVAPDHAVYVPLRAAPAQRGARRVPGTRPRRRRPAAARVARGQAHPDLLRRARRARGAPRLRRRARRLPDRPGGPARDLRPRRAAARPAPRELRGARRPRREGRGAGGASARGRRRVGGRGGLRAPRPRGAPRGAARARRAAPALRGGRAPPHRRALGDGARRRARRRGRPRAPRARVRWRARAARGAHLRARRRAVPDRLAEAAPGRALREAPAPGAAEDEDRLLDRRGRARAARAGARAARRTSSPTGGSPSSAAPTSRRSRPS